MYGKIKHRLPQCKKQVSVYAIITTELAYVLHVTSYVLHEEGCTTMYVIGTFVFIQAPTSAGAASATSELQLYTNY